MKRFVSINGENKTLESLNMYTNRAFKFGDGVFESIRIIDGKVINLKYHIDRLIAGAHTLKINTSDEFNHKYFNSTIVADFIIKKTLNIKNKFFWENI